MAKFLFSLIIFLLVGIGSAHGGYTEHFRLGSEHFYAGRFEQAVAKLEESLRLNPLLDEIDIQLAREARKYLEAIALEDKYLVEEIYVA
jgi:tetratricopeptide (TPR) repeat protein